MSLPFFCLPPELRNMIYKLLFETKNKHKTVTPDSVRTRQGVKSDENVLRLSGSLPFLRTCQQVHDEATAILYGNNEFKFEITPLCHLPLRSRSLYRDAYVFLSRIGPQHHAQIQRIQLILTDEYCPWCERITLRSFTAAIELLSKGHNLQTLEVAFDIFSAAISRPLEPEEPPKALVSFFDSHHPLSQRISEITGIKSFSCPTLSEAARYAYVDEELLEEANSRYTEMKGKMEAGYPKEVWKGDSFTEQTSQMDDPVLVSDAHHVAAGDKDASTGYQADTEGESAKISHDRRMARVKRLLRSRIPRKLRTRWAALFSKR